MSWYRKDCNCSDCVDYREGKLPWNIQVVTPEHVIKSIEAKKSGKWGTAVPNFK